MKKLCTISGCALVVAFLLAPCDANAQRYRYMDSSGNIHFVDSWKQVPREFREQIVPPTPTPVLDERAKKDLQRRQEREVKEAKRKADQRKREIEKSLKAAQKQNRSAAPRGEPPPVDQGRSQDDRIEMIR